MLTFFPANQRGLSALPGKGQLHCADPWLPAGQPGAKLDLCRRLNCKEKEQGDICVEDCKDRENKNHQTDCFQLIASDFYGCAEGQRFPRAA